jgi:hypothetical protein
VRVVDRLSERGLGWFHLRRFERRDVDQLRRVHVLERLHFLERVHVVGWLQRLEFGHDQQQRIHVG